MTIKQKKSVTSSDQPSLFDLLIQERDERQLSRPGRLNINALIQAAIKAAIRRAPKSRETIADEMTELSGERITVAMINNWTADSHPHDMPGRFYTALCVATGDNELVRLQTEAVGLFTVQGPDALRAEKQRELDNIKKRQKKVRQMDALIDVLEAKQ